MMMFDQHQPNNEVLNALVMGDGQKAEANEDGWGDRATACIFQRSFSTGSRDLDTPHLSIAISLVITDLPG